MKGVEGARATHVLGAKPALNPALLTTVKVLLLPYHEYKARRFRQKDILFSCYVDLFSIEWPR